MEKKKGNLTFEEIANLEAEHGCLIGSTTGLLSLQEEEKHKSAHPSIKIWMQAQMEIAELINQKVSAVKTALTKYPDLKLSSTSQHEKLFTTRMVNSSVTDCKIHRGIVGFTYALPYLEENGIQIFSQPSTISLGRFIKEDCEDFVIAEDWEATMSLAKIPQPVIEKVKAWLAKQTIVEAPPDEEDYIIIRAADIPRPQF